MKERKELIGIKRFSGESGKNALKTKYCLSRSVAKASLFCLGFLVLSEREEMFNALSFCYFWVKPKVKIEQQESNELEELRLVIS